MIDKAAETIPGTRRAYHAILLKTVTVVSVSALIVHQSFRVFLTKSCLTDMERHGKMDVAWWSCGLLKG